MMQNDEGLAEYIRTKKAEEFFGTTKWSEALEKAKFDAESSYDKKNVSLIQKAVDEGMSVCISKDKSLNVIVISIPDIKFRVSMLHDDVSTAFFNAVHGILWPKPPAGSP